MGPKVAFIDQGALMMDRRNYQCHQNRKRQQCCPIQFHKCNYLGCRGRLEVDLGLFRTLGKVQ